MDYFITKYTINDIVVNKIIIEKECWIMVYNYLEKKIMMKPEKVNNSIFETINNFCIKDTEEEIINVIKDLGLSGINNDYQTVIDKAIKEISEYTSS